MKNIIYKTVLSLLAIGVLAFCNVNAQEDQCVDVAKLKTFGTMGKQQKPLEKGIEAELFNYEGKGCLTHMWFGGNFKDYGKTRIRIYVDGEEEASIDMELHLGHGIGFQDSYAPWGIEKIGKTGQPSGVYNTYRIPFGVSVKVTAQLAEGLDINPSFWWIIRGTENLRVQIGGEQLPESARLKLYKLENYKADVLEEFDLYKTNKSGALYQVTMQCESSQNLSYQEACIRAYVGEKEKLLWLSSGLEDYFLGTYYFNRGRYYTPVAGVTHLDKKTTRFSGYRFHDRDPVFFQNGFRLTNRCGEKMGDHKFHNPQRTTYTCYTWVYEW
jgi:hypothetical protein